MKQEYYSATSEEREKIITGIKELLFENDNIVFAYIYGSFVCDPYYNDIDLGVFLKNNIDFDTMLSFTGKVAADIGKKCNISSGLPDVRILNEAPSPFLNSIFKFGRMLFTRDEIRLTDMIENTSLDAMANEHISYQSLKELVPS